MTRQDLIRSLSGPFYEGFADSLASRVCEAECVETLYDVAVAEHRDLSAAARHKVRFRSAYVLEKIFFTRPELFGPLADVFCREDFPACTDASARRHFAKIMAHLLRTRSPEPESLDRIAECAAQWILEPQTKVAVKVWAVEILKSCRERVGWVAEAWPDLLETLASEATPGISSRLRRSWK